MIITDMHNHTDFSGDCHIPMATMIQSAKNKGIKYMTITEHHDIDFPDIGINFELNIPTYITTITDFIAKQPKDFHLLIGIEFGMQSHLNANLRQIVKDYPFDFIIASNHLVNGKDPYDKSYFDGLTRDEGYLKYFECLLNNITLFNDFDSLAHLDYVIRYWRGDHNRRYNYHDFKEIIDAILKMLIKKDKALEVNTSGYRNQLNQPHPSYDVLRRYYELGGELITIGSDAHRAEDLGSNFDIVEANLKSIGFKSYATFIKRKVLQIGFD